MKTKPKPESALSRRGPVAGSVSRFVRNDALTQDMLALGDRDVPLAVIARWSARQVLEAELWVAAVHFVASDNPGRIPPEPLHVRRYSPHKKLSHSRPE